MGHIELAAPVSHIWYFKGIPSRMGLILDLSPQSAGEGTLFCFLYRTDFEKANSEYKQVFFEKEFQDARETWRYTAGTGAGPLRPLRNPCHRKTSEELQTGVKGAPRRPPPPTRQSPAGCLLSLSPRTLPACMIAGSLLPSLPSPPPVPRYTPAGGCFSRPVSQAPTSRLQFEKID